MNIDPSSFRIIAMIVIMMVIIKKNRKFHVFFVLIPVSHLVLFAVIGVVVWDEIALGFSVQNAS